MTQFYLRIEAVNLAHFVYDTQDLSTIRGGGLLLLNSTQDIQRALKEKGVTLRAITTGASSALFEFDANDADKAEQVRKLTETFLNGDPALKHATFVVDILPTRGEEKFSEDREQLIAMNRWRQMQSPSVAVPSSQTSGACYIDMVRPAEKREPYKDKGKVAISESVFQRRTYGKEQKQKFYGQATGLSGLPDFVHDLDELTDDKDRETLHHKMAVIYIDGNWFGRIQEDLKQVELSQWDMILKQYRREMLASLLKETAGKPEWMNITEHRMETLLWGGDEIIWVVPAWVGWWTLSFFYRHAKQWKFGENFLKHGAGIVFCHHNAPIHRIKDLAIRLADLAKLDRNRNLFAYQILESFDHVGKDLVEHRQSRCPIGVTPQDLILNGEDMDVISQQMLILKRNIGNEFPRNKLHLIIRQLFLGVWGAEEIIRQTLKGLDAETRDALYLITSHFNGDMARWLHIADLWDYAI